MTDRQFTERQMEQIGLLDRIHYLEGLVADRDAFIEVLTEKFVDVCEKLKRCLDERKEPCK